jgi:hypothetical protein
MGMSVMSWWTSRFHYNKDLIELLNNSGETLVSINFMGDTHNESSARQSAQVTAAPTPICSRAAQRQRTSDTLVVNRSLKNPMLRNGSVLRSPRKQIGTTQWRNCRRLWFFSGQRISYTSWTNRRYKTKIQREDSTEAEEFPLSEALLSNG